jgi:phospholipase/carboxylesterase
MHKLEYVDNVNTSKFLLVNKFAVSLQASSEAELFIMIHGRAGNAKVIAAFLSSIKQEANVISPEAPNPEMGGFSWWLPESKALTISDFVLLAEGLYADLQSIIELQNLKPKRITLLGFSQGAAMCSMIFQLYPSVFSRLVILAGAVPEIIGKDGRLQDLTPFVGKEVFIAHGSKDEIIPIDKAERAKIFLEKLACNVTFSVEDVAHKVGSASMKALKSWANQ